VPISLLLLFGSEKLALALFAPHALLFALYVARSSPRCREWHRRACARSRWRSTCWP